MNITNITQDLQDVGNARNNRSTVNPANRFYSTWLTSHTQVWTGSDLDLLAYAESIGLEVQSRINTRTGQVEYHTTDNTGYTGSISQPEYEDEKALAPNGWIFIHVLPQKVN